MIVSSNGTRLPEFEASNARELLEAHFNRCCIQGHHPLHTGYTHLDIPLRSLSHLPLTGPTNALIPENARASRARTSLAPFFSLCKLRGNRTEEIVRFPVRLDAGLDGDKKTQKSTSSSLSTCIIYLPSRRQAQHAILLYPLRPCGHRRFVGRGIQEPHQGACASWIH
jgi:hypothetical protein